MKQYDYSALTSPLTGEELQKLPLGIFNRFRIRYVAVAGGILFGLGCLLWLVGTILTSVTRGSVADIVTAILLVNVGFAMIIIATVVLIVVAIMHGVRETKKRRLLLTRFARSNGASYRYDVFPAGMKGMIFDQGHSRKITDALTFAEQFEVGNYQYVTGSGKHRQTHNFSYVRVTLNRPLPNMVFDSKHNNFLGMTNLPDVYHASQRLQLEGDFNNSFDVYVPAGYERDALYVLTPDVMAMLVDLGGKYDLEVVDNELYIYYPVPMRLDQPDALSKMIDMVNKVVSEFGNQARRYADERVESSLAGVAVAPAGKRLKSGVNWKVAVVVAAFILLQVLTPFVPDSYRMLPMLGFGVLLWGVVIFAVISSIRRRS